jgi:ATP-binding cassette subfamily B (MDR/TAP) protein 1
MDDAAAAAAVTAAKEREGKENHGGDAAKKVSLVELFQYADAMDMLLMVVGFVAALASGLTQPLMTVIFGQLINAFGGAATETILDRVTKVTQSAFPVDIGSDLRPASPRVPKILSQSLNFRKI